MHDEYDFDVVMGGSIVQLTEHAPRALPPKNPIGFDINPPKEKPDAKPARRRRAARRSV
jgi:hypothetical protein